MFHPPLANADDRLEFATVVFEYYSRCVAPSSFAFDCRLSAWAKLVKILGSFDLTAAQNS